MMAGLNGGGTSVIVRLEIHKEFVTFGKIATAIGDAGGDIVAIDVTRASKTTTTRDITVKVSDPEHTETITKALKGIPGVRIINVSDQTFLMHLGGKIEVTPKDAD